MYIQIKKEFYHFKDRRNGQSQKMVKWTYMTCFYYNIKTIQFITVAYCHRNNGMTTMKWYTHQDALLFCSTNRWIFFDQSDEGKQWETWTYGGGKGQRMISTTYDFHGTRVSP